MRSEIGEIGEDLDQYQVGSSTMPHKINPKNFENVKSLWKAFMPRMATVYMDQISEHQRDLTNSASMRFFNELAVATFYATRRLKDAIKKTQIIKEALTRNLENSMIQLIDAEPLYIAFALTGHPDGYYKARSLVLEARRKNVGLLTLLDADPEAMRLLKRFFWGDDVGFPPAYVFFTSAVCLMTGILSSVRGHVTFAPSGILFGIVTVQRMRG